MKQQKLIDVTKYLRRLQYKIRDFIQYRITTDKKHVLLVGGQGSQLRDKLEKTFQKNWTVKEMPNLEDATKIKEEVQNISKFFEAVIILQDDTNHYDQVKRALIASRLAAQILPTNGFICYTVPETSYFENYKHPIDRYISDCQVQHLSMIMGEREDLETDQLILTVLTNQTFEDMAIEYIKQWADGVKRPSSGTFVKFKQGEVEKEFDIQESWDTPKRQGSAKPPKVLKDAGNNAIKQDALDQQVQNMVLRDLGMPLKQPNNFDAVEQLLNQHKIQNKSPMKIQMNQQHKRLAKVEKLCHSQRQELKEKSDIIYKLREQLQEAQGFQNNSQEQNIQEIKKLKEENLQLQQKVFEMEKFLLKYGIKWVGDKDADQKMKQIVSDVSQPKPRFNYQLPKEISIDVIQKRIDELNFIMEKDGVNQIVKNANGMHQFQKMESLPIGFYQNGIAMKGFKFFSYGSNDSYQILADILDGYFPYQLKHLYPNGTLLKVIDKTDQLYDSEKLNKADVMNIDERQLKPMSKDEFLQKLPQNVIKDGKAIPIRSEIEKFFNPAQDDDRLKKLGCRYLDGNWIVSTPAQLQLDKGIEPDNLCTLKFRTETGKYQIIALMFSYQTIQEMYNEVIGLREFPDKQVEIILNFPRTIFQKNDTTSLEDAGLIPNNLNLQVCFCSSVGQSASLIISRP
ncbi:hypothetical protein pb186bvf_003566 [Paramecium bursaria]